MDLESTDARTHDVSRRISRVSLCYYSDAEVLSLSVCEILHSAAFDAVGRPTPAGLYAPALGTTSHHAGACVTCGQGYQKCPGHFGHIALPVPLVHPHLSGTLYRVLRAACWYCGALRADTRRKVLGVARLRFEQAGMHDTAEFVKAYAWAGDGGSLSGDGAQAVAKKAVEGVVRAAPWAIKKALRGVNLADERAVDGIVVRVAEERWEKAVRDGTLVEEPGAGWDDQVSELLTKVGSKCVHCSRKLLNVVKGEGGSFCFGTRANPSVVLGPMQLADQLRRVWSMEKDFFDLVFGLKGRAVRKGMPPMDYSLFFVRNLLVPPSRFRPAAAFAEAGMAVEHPQNIFYQRILMTIEALGDLKQQAEDAEAAAKAAENGPRKDVDMEDVGLPQASEPEAAQDPASLKRSIAARKASIVKLLADMQKNLIELYDSPGGDLSRNGGAMGIRQQLESKQGLFRMHMMGKRVNFSCRSVIGPDVFLDTNEVGIPESFAKLLTIAEPVTSLNLAEMRAAVLNGPDVYPGAIAIEDTTASGNLQVTVLKPLKAQREVHAKVLMRNSSGAGGAAGNVGSGLPKRVLRHLRTGDLVLFNRQPTLHRVSMMAHRVRVLPGDRTIRFHYANCRSYNADFDGDEMNIHVPQDPVARAEAEQLMLSDRHYIVPTSGAPIRDLIQDHILASALITNRDTFFTRGEFCSLLYPATERIMSGTHMSSATRFRLPIPAVLKPVPLFTGKQLISAVLTAIRGDRPGISLDGRSRVTTDLVGKEEVAVLFRHGELLRGVLDKNAFGASMFGIVHAVQHAYGAASAGSFLSAIGRLCTLFLRHHGHTTGVDDLMLVNGSDEMRTNVLRRGVMTIGGEAAATVQESFVVKGESLPKSKRRRSSGNGEKKPQLFDDFIETRGLLEKLVRNKGDVAEARLDSAINSKLNALASVVNKCIPKGLVKKYPRNGFSLMTDTGAKGSGVNSRQISCLLGPTIMEGKRVPRIGGRGATLPCFAPYDPSPNAGGFIASRFLTGIAPYEMFFHAMAGREGLLDTSLKTANSGYLQRCLIKHMEGVRVHYDYTTRDSDGSVLQMMYGDDCIDPCKSSWLMRRPQWELDNKAALSHGAEEPPSSQSSLTAGLNRETLERAGLAKPPRKPSTEVRKLRKRLRRDDSKTSTVLESMSPGAVSRFGVVSESFHSSMRELCRKSGEAGDKEVNEAFLMERYQNATIEPGDGVGVIAAHSVGEPSTQMTLNTFHHAGSESKHVTLGVPRLRELLMTASKYPKTPSMTLPLLEGKTEADAQEVSKRFANVSLLDLMKRVVIHEGGVSSVSELGGTAVHAYSITLEFPKESLYKKEVGFGFRRIFDVAGREFLAHFTKAVERELKKSQVKSFKPGGASVAVGDDAMPTTFGEQFDDDDEAGDDTAMLDDDAMKDGDDDKSDDDEDGGDSDGKNDSESEGGSGSGGDSSGEEPDGAGAKGDIADDNMEDAIRAWKESKLAEREALASRTPRSKTSKQNGHGKPSAAKSAAKPSASKKGVNGSVSKPPKSNGSTQGAPADDDVSTDDADSDKESTYLASSMGLTGNVRAEDGRRVVFPWVLPHEATGRIRLAHLVKEAASQVNLAHVERITKCFKETLTLGGSSRVAVATEGSNIAAVCDLGAGLVDLDHISTNDMYGILGSYGVEALRAALVMEFKKIFDAYGIDVNVRHLSLIADYMTAHGGYRGFNRGAMDSVPSLFQQFSFETTMKFMTQAALKGKQDAVRAAPSTSIATGELYSGGTGCFELLTEL